MHWLLRIPVENLVARLFPSGYYFIVRADENTTCVENLGYFFEDAVKILQDLSIVVPFIEGETKRDKVLKALEKAIPEFENS